MRNDLAGYGSFPIERRPAPPSRRMRRAHMSRESFIGLVAIWSAALLLIFAVSVSVGLAG